MNCMQVSIVIRTLNEEKYLRALLESINSQKLSNIVYEVVLVDSGSTDSTLNIAVDLGCKIYHIMRHDFSFGRSLNIGCEASKGDILVFISGHCVPTDEYWLQRLCQPLLDGISSYSYGRQVGGEHSYFSECRIYSKYFPEKSVMSQNGFYCNNANAALLRSAWESYRFDEELTGLEDMHLAQRLFSDKRNISYIADATVFHFHNESWLQVRRRFEREAIALQSIMPQVHFGKRDLVRYLLSSIVLDWVSAWKQRLWTQNAINIILYRFNQYWGGFRGNRQHRKLSQAEKDKYFFPK